MPSDEAALADIFNFARMIVERTASVSEEQFLEDVYLQDSVLYRITTLGEATKRLSAEFQAEHPEIPWRQIAGLRDRVIHGYDEVDLQILWGVVRRDIPNLIDWLERNLPAEE